MVSHENFQVLARHACILQHVHSASAACPEPEWKFKNW